MNQNILLLSNILIAGLDFFVIIFCTYYFMLKLERNIYRKRHYYIIGTIVIIAVLAMLTFSQNNLIGLVGFVLSVAIMGHLLFNNSRTYFLYYLIFAIFILTGQLLVVSIFNIVVINMGINYEYGIIYSDVIMLIKQMVELMLTKLLTEFFRRRKFGNISLAQMISYLLLPLVSIVFILTLGSFATLMPTTESFFAVTINVILLGVLNLYVTFTFEKMTYSSELEKKLSLYDQKAQMQYRYYAEMEKKYQCSRKLIHDMRNHLHIVEQLYAGNEQKENSRQAAVYMNDLHEMLNELGQKYYCSNRVLDIILNDKEKLAHVANIKMDIQVKEVELSFMKDIDITTLFANILDNAIEAAKKAADKSIKVRIDQFHEFAVIVAENTCLDEPKMQKEKFISDKTGEIGIGFLNIQKVVDSYQGIISTKYKNNKFQVSITFPIGGEENHEYDR